MRKLIITSDPGQDQAAAILMILGARESFEVLGLVATAGNIGLNHTLRNCAKLLELADRTDIPIFRGSSRPMKRELVMAEHVHGPTGLDGPDLPEPVMAIEKVDSVELHRSQLAALSKGIAAGATTCRWTDMERHRIRVHST